MNVLRSVSIFLCWLYYLFILPEIFFVHGMFTSKQRCFYLKILQNVKYSDLKKYIVEVLTYTLCVYEKK